MATYNDNNAYIAIDGTQLDTYFVSFSYEPTIEEVDVTAGSGADWRERNEGLKDSSATLVVVYDISYAATMLPLVEVGTHTITYGPEGNATGKPKHVQSMIITGTPHETTVEKTRVILTASMVGAAAPTTDMFSGGVW